MAEKIFTEVELLRMTSSERNKHFTPVTKFVYVKASDVDNINYFTDSVGQVKIVTEYSDLSCASVSCVSTFYYQDSENPTQQTKIIVV